MNIVKQVTQRTHIWFDADIWADCPEEFFDPHYWKQQHAIVGTASGRGETVFFQHQEQQFVLRHYRRGGMVGKVSNDRYFYLGASMSRCYREFQLLGLIQQQGLPAPRPVAIRLVRDGLWYRADLITQRIEKAQDLSQLLARQRLPVSVWEQVGQVIRRFHDAGIEHIDLNIHNIMLDAEQRVWLIDFDKGRQRRPNYYWSKANLDRLLRSLEKERQRMPHWYWLNSDWLALLQGYRCVETNRN